jgi:uncharacterized protein YndB with AHSA1/START domain
MQKQIEHTWFYEHAPEAVWHYLTDAELLAQWLMKNDFKPEQGHEFRFETGPMPNLNFDGIIYCKVLEIVPYSRLSYSWKGGPGTGEMTLDSVVTWTLTPKDNGTEVLLQHFGFKSDANMLIFAAMDAGWLKNMKEVAALLNTAAHGTKA